MRCALFSPHVPPFPSSSSSSSVSFFFFPPLRPSSISARFPSLFLCPPHRLRREQSWGVGPISLSPPRRIGRLQGRRGLFALSSFFGVSRGNGRGRRATGRAIERRKGRGGERSARAARQAEGVHGGAVGGAWAGGAVSANNKQRVGATAPRGEPSERAREKGKERARARQGGEERKRWGRGRERKKGGSDEQGVAWREEERRAMGGWRKKKGSGKRWGRGGKRGRDRGAAKKS